MSPDEATALAGRVLQARYPEADFGFAAGSIVRGEAKSLSDLDLVIVFASLPNARRESFLFEGTPVDAFIHDEETLAFALKEEFEVGRPAMHNMVAEARVVGRKRRRAQGLVSKARAALAAGPAPMSQERLDLLRYHMTDRLDDLRDPRESEELIGIGIRTYDPLAELILRGAGTWAGNGKWIGRHLRALDPQLADDFLAAFEALFARREPAPLIEFLERTLARHGGPLFDGYESALPATSRVVRRGRRAPKRI